MKFAGKVHSKTLNAEGHSQVTIQADVDISKGANGQAAVKASVIISSPSTELVDSFKVGQSVSFTL